MTDDVSQTDALHEARLLGQRAGSRYRARRVGRRLRALGERLADAALVDLVSLPTPEAIALAQQALRDLRALADQLDAPTAQESPR